MKIILMITSMLLVTSFMTNRDYSKVVKINKYSSAKIETNKDVFEILANTVNKYGSMNFYESKGTTTFIETQSMIKKELPKTSFKLSFNSRKEFTVNWKDDNSEKNNCLKVDSQSSVLEIDNKISKIYERTNDAVFDVSYDGEKSRFFVVPLLVFNEKFISPLKNIQRLEDETIDNVSYYKISAEKHGVATNANAYFTYWIEKKSFLIKRVYKEISNGNLTRTTTEEYYDTKFR